MAMTLQKVSGLRSPPSRPYAKEDMDVDDVHWTPYPRSNQVSCPTKPALLRYVKHALATLMELAWEIQDLLVERVFDLDIEGAWAATADLHGRLESWVEELPAMLKVDNNPLPHVLLLQ